MLLWVRGKGLVTLYSSIVNSSQGIWLLLARYFRLYLRISSKQYDLYIRPDTNTNGHMQWFYFSVKNSNKMKVKFNVFRFRKCYSLFQRGFRPYVRSRRQGGDWVAGGERVKYYRQHLQNENGVKKPSNYFYLSFLYSFQH